MSPLSGGKEGELSNVGEGLASEEEEATEMMVDEGEGGLVGKKEDI